MLGVEGAVESLSLQSHLGSRPPHSPNAMLPCFVCTQSFADGVGQTKISSS